MVIHGRGLFSVESLPVKALGKETGSDFPDELQPPDCFHDVLMISTLEGTNFITIFIIILITITITITSWCPHDQHFARHRLHSLLFRSVPCPPAPRLLALRNISTVPVHVGYICSSSRPWIMVIIIIIVIWKSSLGDLWTFTIRKYEEFIVFSRAPPNHSVCLFTHIQGVAWEPNRKTLSLNSAYITGYTSLLLQMALLATFGVWFTRYQISTVSFFRCAPLSRSRVFMRI